MAMSEPEHASGTDTEGQDANQQGTDVDWVALFVEHAGGARAAFDSTTKLEAAVATETDYGLGEADQVVADAREAGGLVRGDGGIVPSKALVAEAGDIDLPADEADDEDGSLFGDIDVDGDSDLAALVEQQAEIIEQQQETIDELSSQVEELRGEVQANNRLFDRDRDIRRGLTELQVRALQNGRMLGRDQLDLDALRHDLGLEIEFVGGDEQYVRLANPENEGDAKNVGSSMPNADDMNRVEQWRQMWRRGLLEREDLKNSESRAMILWDNLEKIATPMDSSGRYEVVSRKAKVALEEEGELEGLQSDSKNTTVGRVMTQLAETYAPNTLVLDKGGTNSLQYNEADLKGAKKPLYKGTESAGGKIVVNN